MTNTPAPKCTRQGCNHYASHGQRCAHVDCPCRKFITARLVGNESATTEVGGTRRLPSQRTDREYD